MSAMMERHNFRGDVRFQRIVVIRKVGKCVFLTMNTTGDKSGRSARSAKSPKSRQHRGILKDKRYGRLSKGLPLFGGFPLLGCIRHVEFAPSSMFAHRSRDQVNTCCPELSERSAEYIG